MITVEQVAASLQWTVTCDDHGIISEHQTTSEYALNRSLTHAGEAHAFEPQPEIVMYRHSGNKWSVWRPEQVWKWLPDVEAGQRSTRKLIEKRARA